MNASFEQFTLSPSLADELHHRSISSSVVHIFLPFTTFLGNSLILVALHLHSSAVETLVSLSGSN